MGETFCVPVVETLPTPWSIVTLVALVTVQERVTDPPVLMLAGVTVNCITGSSCLLAVFGILIVASCSAAGAVVVAAGVEVGGVDSVDAVHE